MIRPMCSFVGGGGRVMVAIDVGRGLSAKSRLAILRGVEGINRHSEIATATKINPSGKCIPRGFVRREKIRRRDISDLILHRFNGSPSQRVTQKIIGR